MIYDVHVLDRIYRCVDTKNCKFDAYQQLNVKPMKTILKLEEIPQIILGMYLFDKSGYPWWVFAALILTPDISMIGYGINDKVGAILYNIFHHKGLAIMLGMFGWIGYYEVFLLAGIIMYTHSSIDRLFDFGLKQFDGFKYTHLGKIGKTSH